MMVHMKKIFLLLFSIMLLGAAAGAQEPVERIVAVVGNEPILSSELAAQLQLMAIQQGIRPKTEKEMRQFQKQVLDDIISERLLLIEAKKDTMINVSDDQIEQAIDDHIASLISQFPSEDAFMAELSKEGMTLRAFRKRLRPEMENQLLKQQLVNRKLSTISISNQEVYDFYEKYKDSIPDQPEAVRLAHILLTFQPSKKTEDSVRAVADEVRRNASGGADFATLAITYSDGPGALTGGDLGFISRDDVIPEFGRVAFNLVPGEISGVFRTQYGYHIVKCEAVQGNQAHLRQILFKVDPTAADSALTYQLADSLLTEIHNGADFRELAKVYSADDDTRKSGGELGWFAVKDLPPGFQDAVANLKEVGDVYGPASSEYGLHIIKLMERQEGRHITIDNDFDQIKNMARQSKTGEMVDKWIDEIREKVYVDIRLDEK